MEKILTAAVLDRYSRRKDKSVAITFITQEKSSKEIMQIDASMETFGYLYFKPEETLTKAEIEDLDNLDTDLYDNPKSQSQRLRNVLYRLWEQEGGEGDFKDFYKTYTNKIIQHFKDKLI